MRKRILIIGVAAAVMAVVVILGAVRAVKKREQQKEFSQRREIAVAVEVTKPRVGPIEETRTYVGTIVSTDEATVYSKIPGKVVSVPAKVGARVAAGTTVAVIDYDQPGMKFRYYNADSPINGEITDVPVSVGDTVSPATPLAVVVKPESVKLRTEVPAETLAVMSRDEPVKIRVGGSEQEYVEGEVVNLPRSLSPDSHLATVEIKPRGKVSALRAGMFAQVEVAIARRDKALLVPPQAVRRELGGTVVYVARHGTVARRPVEVGISRADAVEIVSGLTAEDEVIVYANGDLDDGIKVAKKVPYQSHE